MPIMRPLTVSLCCYCAPPLMHWSSEHRRGISTGITHIVNMEWGRPRTGVDRKELLISPLHNFKMQDRNCGQISPHILGHAIQTEGRCGVLGRVRPDFIQGFHSVGWYVLTATDMT